MGLVCPRHLARVAAYRLFDSFQELFFALYLVIIIPALNWATCAGGGKQSIRPFPRISYTLHRGIERFNRDSLRDNYDGIRRVRQLALGCESN